MQRSHYVVKETKQQILCHLMGPNVLQFHLNIVTRPHYWANMCNTIGTRWGQPITTTIPSRQTVKTLSVVQRKQKKTPIKITVNRTENKRDKHISYRILRHKNQQFCRVRQRADIGHVLLRKHCHRLLHVYLPLSTTCLLLTFDNDNKNKFVNNGLY